MQATESTRLAECSDNGVGSAETTETRELHQAALELLAELPEHQQEVVRLKFQSGLSYREIGDVTGLSVSNVGYLLHVALKTIRQRLASPHRRRRKRRRKIMTRGNSNEKLPSDAGTSSEPNLPAISDNDAREARLTAYALGELDKTERTAVEAELAGSEALRMASMVFANRPS